MFLLPSLFLLLCALPHLSLFPAENTQKQQIMPPFDREMVEPMQDRLRAKGVELCLGDSVKGFSSDKVCWCLYVCEGWQGCVWTRQGVSMSIAPVRLALCSQTLVPWRQRQRLQQ